MHRAADDPFRRKSPSVESGTDVRMSAESVKTSLEVVEADAL